MKIHGPLQHPGLFGLGKHFGGVLGIEFHQEAAPVPLDGGKGEEEFVGDLLACKALVDETTKFRGSHARGFPVSHLIKLHQCGRNLREKCDKSPA